MRRADIAQFMQDAIGFAKVVASRVGASGSPELSVQVSADDETQDSCEWWGHPAVSCKPPAGGEALFIDLGSERVVLGVKERRWQVALEDGDCVVRALGAGTPAHIKLKPDGTIELHGQTFLGGDSTVATFGVPLANLIATAVNAALVGHTHLSAAPANPTGPGVVTVPVLAAAISSATVKAL